MAGTEGRLAPSRHDFERLVRALQPRIAGLLWSRGAPRDAIEDLTQEAFLVLWRRCHELPDDEEEVRRWVFAVVLNLLANERRSELRRCRVVDLLRRSKPDEGSVPPDARLAAVEAWRSLRADHRELLLRRGWDGATNPVLAAQDQCSERAVEMRVHRARRELRESL